MVVTEKCDVYSFGVLALEVLMGKHPGELITSLQNPGAARNINFEDLSDRRLSPPVTHDIADKLAFLVRLSVSCLSSKPEFRPNMRTVNSLIESH